MPMLKKAATYSFLALSLAAQLSCSKAKEQKGVDSTDVLIEVGDSALTRRMVTELIPSGLGGADSIRMFDAIVEAWVERNMLVNLAGSQVPDIEKIERMVEQYREQLLANEYRKMMASDKAGGISQASIEEYYKAHPEQYRLSSPLIKGIYLKVQKNSPDLDELRAWVRRGSDNDIDNLENYGLKSAMEYDYFGDTWVDWQTIADHIPYRFSDADNFVRDNSYFECTEKGSVYMLRITDFLTSGEQTPLSFAEAGIREQLLEQKRGDYDRQLLNSLFTEGINARTIKTGAYTPIKYRNQNTSTKP
jgi:hypothetical protein